MIWLIWAQVELFFPKEYALYLSLTPFKSSSTEVYTPHSLEQMYIQLKSPIKLKQKKFLLLRAKQKLYKQLNAFFAELNTLDINVPKEYILPLLIFGFAWIGPLSQQTISAPKILLEYTFGAALVLTGSGALSLYDMMHYYRNKKNTLQNMNKIHEKYFGLDGAKLIQKYSTLFQRSCEVLLR